MDSLSTIDLGLFRFVNLTLRNPVFDWLLPYVSSNTFFVPGLMVLAIWLVRKGGVRGKLLVCFLLLTFVIGDPLIVNSLKKFIDRPRPFASVPDIRLLVGRGDSASMPSAHAANWFAAATVAFVYYRRSIYYLLPLALLVGFSRIYLGAHFPSDVAAGALLGVAYAAAVLWSANALWCSLGRRWFPEWWGALPSLTNPPDRLLLNGVEKEPRAAKSTSVDPLFADRLRAKDQQWLRLAYVLIGVLLVGHLAYIASGKIELSEDEAYQWLWSKHLALSYFSKPPLIAYTQYLGTSLWGDTVLGVRFFSPVLGAIGSLLVVRFLAREVNGVAACLSVLVASAVPILMVGSTLMTIDCLSVLFWIAATVAGWKAVRDNSTSAWLWTGLWMGLGFLSKYIALFQWVCWALFLILWPAARVQLRRPGPYLALGINLICTIPVLAWNAQNDWITLTHLGDRGGLSRTWEPTLRFFWDFAGAELLLLNPVFCIGMIWAAVLFWRRYREHAWATYVFSMGAPLFLFYLLYTLRARVQPNWIAPAILPLFCLMLMVWVNEWRNGRRAVRHWLMAGLTLGWLIVIPLHDTRLIRKAFKTPLPVEMDPLRRVLGWKEMAEAVSQARADLLTEGQPVFVIGNHYGITSLLTFYMPEAKAGVPDRPLVYSLTSEVPKNQFWFWPGYQQRKGENAIYVAGVRNAKGPPPILEQQFASVTDLGIKEIRYRGRLYHRVQLFACRDLR